MVVSCITNDDCVAAEFDGCCMRWEVEGIAEDPYWGDFSLIWGGDEAITVGGFFDGCSAKAYEDAHFAANPDGRTNNYADLQNFLENVPGAKDNLGVEDIDGWISAWDGDVATQEGFLLNVQCVDSLTESGAASLMTVASVAALAAALY